MAQKTKVWIQYRFITFYLLRMFHFKRWHTCINSDTVHGPDREYDGK
jgi:hypothetical protein